MKYVVSLLLLLCLSANVLLATHNRAGEITFRRISGFTYEVKVLTYTVESSSADDNEIFIEWGDGEADTLARSNGPILNGFPNGEPIGNETKMNIYIGVHSYPGPGNYEMLFVDPNRNEGVINIPNSIQMPFAVSSMVVINPFEGANSSPYLLHPPLDNACVGEVFIHNPAAYDADGDSLAYKLIPCSGDEGQDINGYFIPAEVSINEYTGDLIWDAPTQIGEYNYAIKIEEWRNGTMIGFVVRDLQVYVDDCANDPPVIESIDEKCVTAGDSVFFDVLAYDPNIGDNVTLSSYGGVYELDDSPAQFTDVFGPTSVNSSFGWQTNCSHVQNQPYYVLFKAKDNHGPVPLSASKTVSIRVVAPAPENLILSALGNSIEVSWSPSICSNAIGYKIYRGEYYGFNPDTCELGVPAYTGYTLAGTTSGYNDTTFVDDNNNSGLVYGIEYCYMVVACFADGAESYASEEMCTTLNRDMPIITNVSVDTTSSSVGEIYVAWSKPTELDFAQTPGPFKYELYRSESNGPDQLVYTTTDLNDTIFTDTLLDTESHDYSYYVSFYNETPGNSFKIGDSQEAYSIYLSMIETDNTLILNWTDQTPWSNSVYRIHMEEPLGSGNFNYLDSSLTTSYTVDSLVNGSTYCFKIESQGAYFTSGLINPIINYSQVACGSPIDTTAPCPPQVIVESDCFNYENAISWFYSDTTCADDVVSYNVYFKPTYNDDFSMVNSFLVDQDTSMAFSNLESVAGCYYVTAVDSFGNESHLIVDSTYCVDNCPEYELPNIFTPNGDGINDYFGPFPYRYVDHVETRIYNRWGNLVFEELNDPEIFWDGRIINTNKPASSGVYYYVCDVYFFTLNGIEKKTMKSFFHLMEFDNSNNPISN